MDNRQAILQRNTPNMRGRRGVLLILAPLAVLLASVLGISYMFLRTHSNILPAALATTTPKQSAATITPTAYPFLGPIPATTHPLQAGVVFPQYGTAAYGSSDTYWGQGLQQIHDQTHAAWVEMPINFYQPSSRVPTITTSADKTPSVESMVSGIKQAHRLGYHVFVTPFITVGDLDWVGYVQYPTDYETSQWFTSFFQIYQPYIEAAEANNVEQLAIGTEMDGFEAKGSSAIWLQYIDDIRAIYTGQLTYDANHDILDSTHYIPSWMTSPKLKYIGVSMYRQILKTPTRPDISTVASLWDQTLRPQFDALSIRVHHQLIFSEIGYRNSSDALYQPWMQTTTAPADPELQAAAYNGALASVANDTNIVGLFFWGWSVPVFDFHNFPSGTQVLADWYSKLTAGGT